MSTLEVEDHNHEYAGHLLRVRTLIVDGRVLSSMFPVFDSSAAIPSVICKECYSVAGIPSCTESDVLVRRHGQTVYWVNRFVDGIPGIVEPGRILEFSVGEYERILGGSAVDLPTFGALEIRTLLLEQVRFPYEAALYTDPAIGSDPQGKALWRAVDATITESELRVGSPPLQSARWSIGFDVDGGLGESLVELGDDGDEVVLRFVSNPEFPLWVTANPAPATLLGLLRNGT